MRSDRMRPGHVARHGVFLGVVLGAALVAAQPQTPPHFYPDDPHWVDDDQAYDARRFRETELSEAFDLLENQLTSPGDRRPIRALNVNTLGEVPDSSWFTNRIGVRDLSLDEIVRGPNKFETASAATWDTWTVTQGKGPGGFHPGFRATRPGDRGQVYQLEIDPIGYPRLATGAEMVGTLIYHALGYHVQDVYPIRVHPSKFTIAPDARIRDASGRRRFTQHDLDNILRNAARDAEGRVYLSATRYEEGEDVGQFEYHGVRRDDPNDLYPHEHRRELRANRVFGAWLAHDDSRAVNTRNLRQPVGKRLVVRHYMHDFGALLGSATRFPDAPIANHQGFLDGRSSLVALFTLGLKTPRALTRKVPPMPPSAGWFESVSFDPPEWRANYPNTAFDNMQPEDAFWGARLVSRFSDAALRAIVTTAGYDDPAAIDYLSRTLGERRDAIARVWLNGVNPVVRPALSAAGELTFGNAAVEAGVASGGEYRVTWARFDNATGQTTGASTASTREPRATAPAELLATASYVVATITGAHAEHPGWSRPARVYFRRDGDRWTTVGLYRD